MASLYVADAIEDDPLLKSNLETYQKSDGDNDDGCEYFYWLFIYCVLITVQVIHMLTYPIPLSNTTIITLIWQMRKLEHTEFKKLAQGYRASKWQNRVPEESTRLIPQRVLWTIHHTAFIVSNANISQPSYRISGNQSRAIPPNHEQCYMQEDL